MKDVPYCLAIFVRAAYGSSVGKFRTLPIRGSRGGPGGYGAGCLNRFRSDLAARRTNGKSSQAITLYDIFVGLPRGGGRRNDASYIASCDPTESAETRPTGA